MAPFMPGQIEVPFPVGMRSVRIGRPFGSTAFAPVQFVDERSGVEELAIGSVENVEKTVAVSLHEQMAGLPLLLQIHQHRGFVCVVVIDIVGRELEVPFELSGVGIEGEDARGVAAQPGCPGTNSTLFIGPQAIPRPTLSATFVPATTWGRPADLIPSSLEVFLQLRYFA